ncbi:MAG: SGNH/GDSL hydrolase family protein [Treponema sp.]|jgi:hypothetical protein|nr:SGNH/GDSL hydrolase family protein [Treponema sp.]
MKNAKFGFITAMAVILVFFCFGACNDKIQQLPQGLTGTVGIEFSDDYIKAGDTLTGVVSGSNAEAQANNFIYRWQLKEQNAPSWATPTDGNSKTYQTKDADKERLVRLVVSHPNFEGNIISDPSLIRDPGAPPPENLTGVITIISDGKFEVGAKLTAKVADSNATSGFNYNWQRSANGISWTSIKSNAEDYYLTVNEDGDRKIKVVVTCLPFEGSIESSAENIDSIRNPPIDPPGPGGSSDIPAVEVGGDKYDLVLWEGYAAASENWWCLELQASDTGPYGPGKYIQHVDTNNGNTLATSYGTGVFNPAWFQEDILLDVECSVPKGGLIYILMFDTDTGAWTYNSAGAWDYDTDKIINGHEDDKWYNARYTYNWLFNRQSDASAPWSTIHSDGFASLKRLRFLPTDKGMSITKVTLRDVPLASAPVGYNNAGIYSVGGEDMPSTVGGAGTKASPYTASITVPPTQATLAASDIRANYPMFAKAAIYAASDFSGDPMKSATFLPESEAKAVYIEMTAGDKITKRYFKISVTRQPGFVPIPGNMVTRTVFEGNYDRNVLPNRAFNISKSGNRQAGLQQIFGTDLSTSIHAFMDFEYIIEGGYIEVTATEGGPGLYLCSDQTKANTIATGNTPIEPTKVSVPVSSTPSTLPNTTRFDSKTILDTIEENFGYDNIGTRNPTVLAGLYIDHAMKISKITVTYDPSHPSLKTFDTLNEVYEAAITYPGNTARVKAALNKAANGQKITVVFLGGSITTHGTANQGYTFYPAGTRSGKAGYACKVIDWFDTTFGSDKIDYVNDAYGGATSWGAIKSLDKDGFVGEGNAVLNKGGLLVGPDGTAATRLHEPDIVFFEFSVNDSLSGWSYIHQGPIIDKMIERVLAESNAGVIMLNTLDFDSGQSADVIHGMVAKKRDVSVVNLKAALWPNFRVGKTTPYNRAELAGDNLHPIEAGTVAYKDIITYRLNQIRTAP